MTVMFADSFDTYASAADMINLGKWTGTSFPAIVGTGSTRFNYGQSMQLAATNHNVNKDGLPNSSNTFVFAVTVFAAPSAAGVVFRESGAAQCSIVWETNGNITVRTGNFNGTVAATFTAGIVANTWHQFQIKVIVHNTAGEVHIRMDGQTTDTWAATAINTRGGTANLYINGFMLTEVSGTIYFDDIMLIDCAGAIPNDFPGDMRCYMLYPNGAGSSTQFAPGGGTLSYNSQAGTFALATNTLFWSAAISNGGRPGTVASFSIAITAGFTGNLTGYVYGDASGSPSGILGASTQVTNPAAGVVTFTFSTPVTIAAGTTYHFAIATDTACSVYTNGSSGANWNRTNTGVSYPTVPATPTGASGGPQFYLTVVWAAANWSNVNEALWDGDTSYVFDSTIGDQDIYAMSDLPSTPAFITALQLRMIARKSDTGFRALSTLFVSGATADTGASTALGTNYAEFDKLYGADPNTGAAWTVAAVNALQAGIKVSA